MPEQSAGPAAPRSPLAEALSPASQRALAAREPRGAGVASAHDDEAPRQRRKRCCLCLGLARMALASTAGRCALLFALGVFLRISSVALFRSAATDGVLRARLAEPFAGAGELFSLNPFTDLLANSEWALLGLHRERRAARHRRGLDAAAAKGGGAATAAAVGRSSSKAGAGTPGEKDESAGEAQGTTAAPPGTTRGPAAGRAGRGAAGDHAKRAGSAAAAGDPAQWAGGNYAKPSWGVVPVHGRCQMFDAAGELTGPLGDERGEGGFRSADGAQQGRPPTAPSRAAQYWHRV